MFDARNQKVAGVYKGACGTLTSIVSCKNKPYVVGVGLDRFLRVWHRDSRKMIASVYLKTRMSGVLIDEEFEDQVEACLKRSADDALWDEMEEVVSN